MLTFGAIDVTGDVTTPIIANHNYPVRMIRHYYIFVQYYIVKMLRYFRPKFIRNFTNIIQPHFPIQNIAEILKPALRTNRYIIYSVVGLIPLRVAGGRDAVFTRPPCRFGGLTRIQIRHLTRFKTILITRPKM